MELMKIVNFQRSLGDETRLKIFCLLMNEELCVRELQRALDLGQSRVSQHLRVLRMAGLVRSRRDGRWVYYGVNWQNVTLGLQEVDMLFRFPEHSLGDLPEAKLKLQQMREGRSRGERAGVFV